MIKLVYCFRRKRGMSFENFSRYWREVHAPLGAEIPGLRRLVQSHALNESGLRADFDGVAELWFEGLDALTAARGTEAWRRSTADEDAFIDPASTAFLLTREHRIV